MVSGEREKPVVTSSMLEFQKWLDLAEKSCLNNSGDINYLSSLAVYQKTSTFAF